MEDSMKQMPERVFVTSDPNDEEDGLLAWPSVEAAEDGTVGIYQLVEIVETRKVAEIRRIKGGKRGDWERTKNSAGRSPARKARRYA
jgi:hypothetical protein